MIKLGVKETVRGLLFRQGRKRCELAWPRGMWRKLPARFREVLGDHLAHLLTIDLPLAAGAEGVEINRARPCFWGEFNTLMLGSIPQAAGTRPRSTTRVLKAFRGIHYRFTTDVPKVPPRRTWKTKPRAVVLFSEDKGSVASLGLARDMGLDPVAVYVDDTVSPGERRIQRSRLEMLKRMGIPAEVVTNEVERLIEPGGRKRGGVRLGPMHRVTASVFLALPVAHALGARYIILGNPQAVNLPFVNQEGFYTYPCFDRTSSWTMQMDGMMRMLTGGGVRVLSLVEPLTLAAVTKLILSHYPQFLDLILSPDCLDVCLAGKLSEQGPPESSAEPFKLYPPATVPVELRTELMLILKDAMTAE